VVSHPRDVVVDEKADRAYVSSPGADTLAVFDTKKLTQLDPIELQSKTRNKPGTMSLVLDAEKDRLYTVSASTNELIIVDLKNDNAQTVFPVLAHLARLACPEDAKNNQSTTTPQGAKNC